MPIPNIPTQIKLEILNTKKQREYLNKKNFYVLCVTNDIA